LTFKERSMPSAPLIRTRLSAMMFLEYLVLGAWAPPLNGYLNGVLGFRGDQIGHVYATIGLGAIVSPLFVGYVADRFFPTQRVLAALHLLGGGFLLWAVEQSTFAGMMTALLCHTLCYMPTLGLANALSFRNIDDPNRFSRIAVWGTIGWIVAGLLVSFAFGESTRPWFFFLAGGGEILLGLYSLSLPHTPPKGAAAAGGDVLGLGAFRLLKEPSFAVFALCALAICIPSGFYSTWGNAFLVENRRPYPTGLMTLSQCSEIPVMLVMPWFIARLGLKRVLVLGMAAWAVRYLCFASLSFPLTIAGLLVHGFCYCFVSVAAYIYVSKKAPPEMASRAQSFIAFLTWGLGTLLGAQLAGRVGDLYVLKGATAVAEAATEAAVKLHDWPPIWLWAAGLAALVALAFWIAGRDVAATPTESPANQA